MAKIDQLFKIMFQQQASDLHITAGSPPYLRLNGEMTKLAMKAVSNEEVQQLIFEILTDKQKRQFVEQWELDFSYTVDGLARFRANVFMQRSGMGAVFRMIPERIRTMEELELPKEIMELIKVHKGLICVTGPTGSGKSTTLAALINYFNANTTSHIITIEDPIEFVHQNQKSLINQREVSSHTKSFSNALRSALREDPDIILLGEMRDLETIQLALTAAETGHLVFGTLHTSSAHKTIDRIIDVFPDSQQAQVRVQLAESLRGVIAQNLLKRADGSGRIAAYEIMVNNKAVSNLIREGKTFQIPSAMQLHRSSGSISMNSSLEALASKNLITREQMNEALGIGPAPAEDSARPSPEPARGSATPSYTPPVQTPPAYVPPQGSGTSVTQTNFPISGTGFSALANRLKKTS